jgi:AraC-like DNA-binding protein
MEEKFLEIKKRISTSQEYIFLHNHPFYEIIFVLQGYCNYLIKDKFYRAEKGNIILIPPGVVHQVVWSEEKDVIYERYVLWVTSEFFNCCHLIDGQAYYAFERCTQENNFVLKMPIVTATGLECVLLQLQQELENNKLNREMCKFSLGLGFMTHLNRTYYNLEIKGVETTQDNLLGAVVSYVDTHLEEKISIEGLAKDLHISKTVISRICKRKLGVSLYQFVIQRRLLVAKNKILEGEEITKAWENTGFSDYSAFFRAFKQHYGLSPKEFQKQHL